MVLIHTIYFKNFKIEFLILSFKCILKIGISLVILLLEKYFVIFKVPYIVLET